jgi:hypothetical protein
MAMFPSVYVKLKCAEYFLDNLKTLAENAGGFPHIKEKEQLRANLDGFFYEVISAKDFFLQGINDYYGLGLRKQKATDMGKLKKCLDDKGESNASGTIIRIEELLAVSGTWLWELNNYRNSATHRELLHFGHVVEVGTAIMVGGGSRDVKSQLVLLLKQIIKTLRQKFIKDTRKINIPSEGIRTYLFKDPEDPQQGNSDIEVIPYCEQSLSQMREFLESLYSNLGIDKVK